MVRIDSRQLRSVAGDSAGPRHPARRGCLPTANRHPGLPARRQCRRACAHPRHPAAPHARWPVLPAGQRHRRLAPARSNRAPSRRRVHRPLSCRPKQGLLIHFFTVTELDGLFASGYTPVLPPRLQATHRNPASGRSGKRSGARPPALNRVPRHLPDRPPVLAGTHAARLGMENSSV